MTGINLGMPVTLNPLRVQQPVSSPLGSYTGGSLQLEQNAHEALARLTACVLARRLVGDQQLLEVRHPATWWQHLKLSLPQWVQKRWPVRYCVTRAKASFAKYDTYPEANILPAEYGKPVQVDIISWTGPSDGWGADCDGSHTATVRSTPVNPGRQFVGKIRLAAELAHLTGHREAGAIIATLERLGVNTSQLVPNYAIEEAHRTW